MEDDFSFSSLSPHMVLNAIEELGLECDGRLLELNSFENRVFQIGIEESLPLITKFYRPGRWNRDQILEEHEFTLDLERQEIPAIAPLEIKGESLFNFENYQFSLYRRQGGHAPELDITDHLESIGRTMGRIHACGANKLYKNRWSYPFDAMGKDSADYLLAHHIPEEYQKAYRTISTDIVNLISQKQQEMEALPYLRLHGDCHLGNILWQAPRPFFVDFDDSCNGPQILDIWMLFAQSTDKVTNQKRLNTFLNGYEMFYDFDDSQLKYTEFFRVLRMMNYASWIGTRWGDPAFKRAFQWFGTTSYWRDHIHDLTMQFERM